MKEEKNFEEKVKEIIEDVKDSTKEYTEKEVEEGRAMALLSYLLPPIPYFCEKENKFVIYHSKQGMNLFVIAIVYAIIYSLFTSVIWWFSLPLGILGLGITALCILGMINVVNGKAKELPIVNKLKLFK